MKKVFKLIGIAVLFAAIVFSMAACDDGSGAGGGNTPGGGGTNPGGGGSPATYSINGSWAGHDSNYYVNIVIKIDGSNGVFTQLNNLSAVWQSAVDKGYLKVGDQAIKNLTKTGDLTWSGQQLGIRYDSNPNVATGIGWANSVFTMSADGQKLTSSDGNTWSRLQ
jgi:hypothetical protein